MSNTTTTDTTNALGPLAGYVQWITAAVTLIVCGKCMRFPLPSTHPSNTLTEVFLSVSDLGYIFRETAEAQKESKVEVPRGSITSQLSPEPDHQ